MEEWLIISEDGLIWPVNGKVLHKTQQRGMEPISNIKNLKCSLKPIHKLTKKLNKKNNNNLFSLRKLLSLIALMQEACATQIHLSAKND